MLITYAILEDALVYFKKVIIVMSVLDECDIEYSVDIDLSDSEFYERGKELSNNSWGLKVARKIVMSSKTFRALRKHGLLSLKEKIWLVGSSPILCATVILSSMCALVASCLVITPMTVWTGLLLLAFLGISITAVIVGSAGDKIVKNIEDRVNERLNINNAGRIELDWSEQDLYGIARSLSNSHDGDDVKLKKMLFELVVPYPADANERINELYKTKEDVPEKAEGSEVVLSDVDGLLEKLFRMRDSSENLQIISQVKHVLWEAIRREKTEQMGVSVEKLSEIADFVNKAEQEKRIPEPVLTKNSREVAAVVSEMNNVDEEPESDMISFTVGPLLIQRRRKW